MEQLYTPEDMLHQLDCPAFIVRNGRISAVNSEAKKLLIEPGISIDGLFRSGYEEFKSMNVGCLMVSLALNDAVFQCSVHVYEDYQLFKPKTVPEPTELKALALAAELLRIPFSDLNIILERTKGIPDEQRAKLNHNLSKIQRLLGNMSDSATVDAYKPRMIICNLSDVLNEAVQNAISLLQGHSVTFSYHPCDAQINGKGNPQLLKRAVYNLISNAVKFANEGSNIDISLKKVDNRLRFSVTNSGSTIPNDIFPTVFSRYSRIAGIEDPRNGLGLGVSLIYGTARAHGGTLLMETPDPNTTRVTMVLSITKDGSTDLRSPILLQDLYGGQDQALIELSEILTYDAYLK